MRWPSILAAGLSVVLLAFGCNSEDSPGIQEDDATGGTQVVDDDTTDDPSDALDAVDAESVLADALAKAKTEDKNVFVHVGNSWADGCLRLEEFLASSMRLLSQDFIVVKIDTDKMEYGLNVAARLRAGREDFDPWMVILDQDGQELISSNGPDGNTGCPIEPPAIEHFMKMVDLAARHSTTETRSELREALEAFAKPFQDPPDG